MKNKLWLLLLLMVGLQGAYGQVSTVTATIVDSDSVSWASLNGYNATYSIQLQDSSGNNVRLGQAYRKDNNTMINVLYQGNMDSSGSLSVTLTSTSYISVPNTVWTFYICPAVNPLSYCFTYKTAINGSQSLSSQLSAATVAPRIGGGIGNYAYADVEVNAIANSSYLNITSNTLRCYTTSWGGCGGGGGGSGTVTTVSVTTANGVSGTVLNPSSTPAISLSLGAINPSSIGQTTPGPGAFSSITDTTITGTTQCAQFNTAGLLTGTGSACGSGGGGAVSSVSNSDSTLTISPTTGAVVASLNTAHTNTWTALQTFGTNISIGGVTATGATGTGNNVFSISPTLTTPNLGTPNSVTLTNATGLPNSGLINSTITIAGSSVALGGSTASFPSPGAIGGTTPASGAFTTLSASTSLTLSAISGSTQCLTVNSSGLVSGSGSACGSGTVSGLTTGYLPKAASATSLANSLVDEGITTANVLTVSDTGGVAVAGTGSSNVGIGVAGTAGTLTLYNATSGSVSLGTVTGALGTVTASLPANTGTIAETNLAQTFSAVQTISPANGLVLSAMTGTTCLEQVSGVVTSTGASCGGSISFPQTVGGTTNSGGIPYFSNGTTLSSSAALAANAIVVGGGAGVAPSTDANATLSAGALSLGASGTAGSVVMGNTTSGTVTLAPVTGALGTVTASLPANTGIVAETNFAQTFSAVQTFPGGDLFQGGVNAQTGTTYTMVASDENKLLTLSNASAVAVTLPQATTTGFGSGAVFAVFNKGAGTVTITPTTSTINGSSNIALTTGNGVEIWSDGTNYQIQQNTSSGGGGLPTGTTGQTVYYAANGTTGTATNAVTVGGTSVTPLGFGGVEVTAPIYVDAYQAAGTIATFNGSCSSATTTSCPIVNGGSLDPNGGVVFAGFADGSGDQEYIRYCSATSTLITFCSTGGGRGYWGATAQTHGSGGQIPLVVFARPTSATTAPYEVVLQTGNTMVGFVPATNIWSNITQGSFLATGNSLFVGGGQIELGTKSLGKDTLTVTGAAANVTNDNANATVALGGNNLQYAIATQAITATTLTAITNAVTPVMPNNGTTAASGVGGVLSSRCQIIWNQATSGTVKFGVAASAAPSALWVTEIDSPGAYVAPTYTTITSTTATQTSGTVTPSAFGTTYKSDIILTLNPGTSNSVSVQLYALVSANTLTIEPGTGCSAWN